MARDGTLAVVYDEAHTERGSAAWSAATSALPALWPLSMWRSGTLVARCGANRLRAAGGSALYASSPAPGGAGWTWSVAVGARACVTPTAAMVDERRGSRRGAAGAAAATVSTMPRPPLAPDGNRTTTQPSAPPARGAPAAAACLAACARVGTGWSARCAGRGGDGLARAAAAPWLAARGAAGLPAAVVARWLDGGGEVPNADGHGHCGARVGGWLGPTLYCRWAPGDADGVLGWRARGVRAASSCDAADAATVAAYERAPVTMSAGAGESYEIATGTSVFVGRLPPAKEMWAGSVRAGVYAAESATAKADKGGHEGTSPPAAAAVAADERVGAPASEGTMVPAGVTSP